MRIEMEKPENLGTRKSPRRRRTRQPWVRRVLARFWSEWRVEALIVLTVAVAIFLLVERMQIRVTLLGWLRQGLQVPGRLVAGIQRSVHHFITNTTLSDLTGYTLLLIAVAVVTWRIRWRLMRTPRFTERTCPRCGGDLHRIHRHWQDRVVNLYVPVRRYGCKDHNCDWHGLRVGSGPHG